MSALWPDSPVVKATVMVGTTVGGLLFAGNLFFVQRLIVELDETKAAVRQLQSEVAVLAYALRDCRGESRGDQRRNK